MMKVGLMLLSSFFILSCSDEVKEPISPSTETKMVKRDVDPVLYSQGARLFQLNCAICHGKNGEGAVNWREPDDLGKNSAPPGPDSSASQ